MSAQTTEIAKYRCKRLYVRGSLANLDLDGDGKIDGFIFEFKNPMRRLNLFGIHNLKLLLDGAEIDSSKIIFNAKNRDYRVKDFVKVGFKDTICYEGDMIKVEVEKEGGLEAVKEHTIELWATILALEHSHESLLAYFEDSVTQ